MKVTVYDIARELNIAQGTVSKALTGYKSVSEELRQKVLETAKRLGYEFNRNASSLARGEIKIGVTYPDVWHVYYNQIVKGIEEGVSQLKDSNVTVVVKKYSSLYSGEELSHIIDEFISEGEVKGVLLFSAGISTLAKDCEKLSRANLPYLVAASEFPENEGVPCVHIDMPTSGRLAAELLSISLPKGAKCAAIIATKDTAEHMSKLSGFCEQTAVEGLNFIGEYCAMDDPNEAYRTAERMFSEYPDLSGIYVVSANTVGVCKYIEESGKTGKVKLIGTDVFEEVVPYLEKGVMTAAIYQSPSLQGRLALTSLFDRILTRKNTPMNLSLAPYPLFKSNYKSFL